MSYTPILWYRFVPSNFFLYLGRIFSTWWRASSLRFGSKASCSFPDYKENLHWETTFSVVSYSRNVARHPNFCCLPIHQSQSSMRCHWLWQVLSRSPICRQSYGNRTGWYAAQNGRLPYSCHTRLGKWNNTKIQTMMLTCGLYELYSLCASVFPIERRICTEDANTHIVVPTPF